MNTKTQEAFNKWWDEVGSEAPTFEADMYEHCKKIALMAYQEALEQPTQEPVAWIYEWEDEKAAKLTFHPDSKAKVIPLYTKEQL